MKKILSVFMVFIFIFTYSLIPLNLLHADTLDPISSTNRTNFVVASLILLGVTASNYKSLADIANNCITNVPDLNPLNSIQGHMLVNNVNGFISASKSTITALQTYINTLKASGTINVSQPLVSINGLVSLATFTIEERNFGGKPWQFTMSGLPLFSNSQLSGNIINTFLYNGSTLVHSFTSYPPNMLIDSYSYGNYSNSYGVTGVLNVMVPISAFSTPDNLPSVDIPRDITQNLQSVDGTLRVNPNAITNTDGISYDTTSPYAQSGALDDAISGRVGTLDDVIGNTITDNPAIPYDGAITDDYVPSAVPVVGPVIDFFHIDFPAISHAMDFSDIWKAHFKPFFTIGTALSNLGNIPTDSTGKFYMVIPTAMGGDGLSHCVLDLTAGAVFLSWARTFIKFSLWLSLGFYIFKLVEPRFSIH